LWTCTLLDNEGSDGFGLPEKIDDHRMLVEHCELLRSVPVLIFLG